MEIWEPLPQGDWVSQRGVVVAGDPYAPKDKFWHRPFAKFRWQQAAILKVTGPGLSSGYHIGYINSRGEPWYCTKRLNSPRVAVPIGREPRRFFAVNAVIIADEVPLIFRGLKTIRNAKRYRNTAFMRY
ncbi:MAG TPA: hypothetical protein VFK07_01225 [Candidatus Paceibacterota bacterium]|nr:hypothetical protein [Candidatus Paceibacterota bacterium]